MNADEPNDTARAGSVTVRWRVVFTLKPTAAFRKYQLAQAQSAVASVYRVVVYTRSSRGAQLLPRTHSE
jgi:hypothetical protein